MNIKLTALLLIAMTTIAHSQIEFEKGYIVNNSGERIECYIKNAGWSYAPKKIAYKLTKDSEKNIGTIESIKEFSVPGEFKYSRQKVAIDRSSNSIIHLSYDKNPEFVEETLFLEVLVDGRATLFYYHENYFTRFFYKKGDGVIEQLVYKPYRTSTRITNENKYVRKILKNNRGLAENNWFRQQLWNALYCESFTKKRFEKLRYQTKPLVSLFNDFNKCVSKDK
ncbi:hypothetical protein [Flagellimonas sp. 2504JD1-5]